jgi:hypothetical protein
MKLELLGLMTGTINRDVVERVIEYGVDNGVLDTLIIYLHDSQMQVHGEIRVKIDWRQHKLLIDNNVTKDADLVLPKKGEVSATVFRKLIELFNDYGRKKGLRYWYNVYWVSDGPKHDAACGITRDSNFKWLNLESVTIIHPVLSELDITASLKVDKD